MVWSEGERVSKAVVMGDIRSVIRKPWVVIVEGIAIEMRGASVRIKEPWGMKRVAKMPRPLFGEGRTSWLGGREFVLDSSSFKFPP